MVISCSRHDHTSNHPPQDSTKYIEKSIHYNVKWTVARPIKAEMLVGQMAIRFPSETEPGEIRAELRKIESIDQVLQGMPNELSSTHGEIRRILEVIIEYAVDTGVFAQSEDDTEGRVWTWVPFIDDFEFYIVLEPQPADYLGKWSFGSFYGEEATGLILFAPPDDPDTQQDR